MFKVGDRVKIITDDVMETRAIGETGIIVDIDLEYIYPYEIKFDNQELEDLVQFDKLGSLFAEDELELIEGDVKMELTEIVFILDKSGSMQSIKQDAIGGFNSFIEEQKKLDGKANVTLILFDDKVEVVYTGVDINEVEDLNETTFMPSGLTAMLDGIGLGIDGLLKRLSEQEEQPKNVVFAIMTDGYENSSLEYGYSQIKTKIENMQKEKDWQFIFLGANIDAVGTAESIGIKGEYAGQFLYNSAGTSMALFNTSEMVKSYRTTGQMLSYEDADKIKKEDKKVETGE